MEKSCVVFWYKKRKKKGGSLFSILKSQICHSYPKAAQPKRSMALGKVVPVCPHFLCPFTPQLPSGPHRPTP